MLENKVLLAIVTSFRKRPDEVVVQNLTAHFSAPLFDAKDVLHTGSRIGVSTLDEVWPEVLAIERRDRYLFKRSRRESNLHVLRTGSRVCIESWRSCESETLRRLYQFAYLATAMAARVGLEPTYTGF